LLASEDDDEVIYLSSEFLSDVRKEDEPQASQQDIQINESSAEPEIIELLSDNSDDDDAAMPLYQIKLYLKWFCSNHGAKSPNLTELGNFGMPSGVGRKGSKPPRKRPKNNNTVLCEENRVPMDTSTSTPVSDRVPLKPVDHSTNYSKVTVNDNAQAFFSPSTGATYQNCFYWPPPNYPTPYPSAYTTPYPTNFYPPPWNPLSSPHPHPLSSPLPHPLSSPQTRSPIHPYKICFKVGNISICNGCRINFTDFDKIVVQHPEYRSYNSPKTGLPASKFGNTYYHLRKHCIEMKSGFALTSEDILVADNVKENLTYEIRNKILLEFGLVL
jgi:hypothetical protein